MSGGYVQENVRLPRFRGRSPEDVVVVNGHRRSLADMRSVLAANAFRIERRRTYGCPRDVDNRQQVPR